MVTARSAGASGAALVTGAANGLGAVLAGRLAARRMPLALLDRDADRLDEVAGRLRDGGADVVARAVDVADPSALRHALAEVEVRFGSVSVCAPFAGVFSADAMRDDRTDAVVHAVNVGHVVACAEWAQDAAARHDHGSHVVLSGSSSGVTRHPHDAYALSKQRLTLEARRLRARGRRLRSGGEAHRVTFGIVHLTATHFGRNTSRAFHDAHVDSPDSDRRLEELDRFLAARGRSPEEVVDELLAAVDAGRTSVQLTGDERTGLRSRIELDWVLPAVVWWQQRGRDAASATAYGVAAAAPGLAGAVLERTP